MKRKGYMLIFAVLFALCGNAVVISHITRERYIYFWDIAGYWKSGMDFSGLLFSRPFDAIVQLYNSILNMDYSLLPVLPISVADRLVSSSHNVFVLAVYNFYALPFSLISLCFYRRVLIGSGIYSGKKLAAAAVMVFTCNALLTPVLGGYLDAAGLPVIAIILFMVYVNGFKGFDLKNAILLSALLVLLSLLRRWYLFWTVSFFPAMLMAYAVWAASGKSWRTVVKKAASLALSGAMYLLILFVFFRRFLERAAFNNFQDAYKAYGVGGILYRGEILLGYFGTIFIVLALLGAVMSIVNVRTRLFAVFLLAQSAAIFFMFTSIQSFGVHHAYLMVAQFMFFAFAGLTFPLARMGRRRLKPAICTAALGLLALNFYYVYFNDAIIPPVLKPLFSQKTLNPRINEDIDKIRQIARYINSFTQNTDKKAYVLASSMAINDDMLSNAELPRVRYAVENLIATNHVDRRDGFPNQFFMADIIAVADPVQYHLRPADQQVVGVLAERILRNTPPNLSLIRTFELSGGVNLHVYQKTGAYDFAFLEYLEKAFKAAYPDHPALYNINYFYGLMEESHADVPGTINYDSSGGVIMRASSKTYFALKNERRFRRLHLDVSPDGQPAALKIYDGKDVLLSQTVTSARRLDLDISRTDRLRFEAAKAEDSPAPAGVSLKNIELIQ